MHMSNAGVTYRKGRADTSHLTARAKIEMLLTLVDLSRVDKSKLEHLKREGEF